MKTFELLDEFRTDSADIKHAYTQDFYWSDEYFSVNVPRTGQFRSVYAPSDEKNQEIVRLLETMGDQSKTLIITSMPENFKDFVRGFLSINYIGKVFFILFRLHLVNPHMIQLC